jgi:gliding motility-associated-like protein
MRTIQLIILFIFLSLSGISQNLVLNPSFEDLTMDCCDYPLGTNQFLMLENWTNANNPPGYTMADLSHRCLSCAIPSYSLPSNAPFGEQDPRTGDGFASHFNFDFEILPITEAAEYIQGELNLPLQANREYIISFWVSLADLVNYTYSNYSVYFTNSQLNENSLFLDYFIPQVTTTTFITETENWQNIKIQFTAQGGEKYFSFGTFLPYDQLDTFRIGCADYDSLHPNSCYDVCYVYLDDVAIYPADAPIYPADAGGDQILCKGESLILGSPSRSQYLYWWYNAEGNLIDTTAQITVSPDSTTFYVLQQKDFKFDETSDTAFVYVSDCADPLYIPNIFSPNGDGNNDIFWVRGEGISEIKNFIVYNRWGEEVHNCKCNEIGHGSNCCGWNGNFRGEDAQEGVYAYYVEAVLLNGETVIKRGNVTLVR